MMINTKDKYFEQIDYLTLDTFEIGAKQKLQPVTSVSLVIDVIGSKFCHKLTFRY